MGAKLDERIEFYKMIALSRIERKEAGYPDTLTEMAKLLKVDYQTVYTWHKKAKELGISKLSGKYEVMKRVEGWDKEWEMFMKQLTKDAVKEGATAPLRTLYAQLKGKMPKTSISLEVGLSADERARRNLEAQKQLIEGGYR